MLAELQKGVAAQNAEERSAALESLVTLLENRGHELSPDGFDEFADALTQLLRSLPPVYANKTAARLTQALLAQNAADKTPGPDASAPEAPADNAFAPDAPAHAPGETADDTAGMEEMPAQGAWDSAAILNTLVVPILAEAEQIQDGTAISAIHQDMLERAAQPHVDAMTTHMIVSRGNDAARVAVTRNPGAVFARSTLTTLAELAISDLSLKNAMAARHDLPEAIADRLWPFLSESSKITLLTARRSETLDEFEMLAREEQDEAEDGGITGADIADGARPRQAAVLEQQIRAEQISVQDAMSQLVQDGHIVSAGILIARLANVAPVCGAHAMLSPAERPLVVMLKAVKAGAPCLADIIRLRARFGIGSSKDSRFAALVMDMITQGEAQNLVRLMGERLEQIMTPRAIEHAA